MIEQKEREKETVHIKEHLSTAKHAHKSLCKCKCMGKLHHGQIRSNFMMLSYHYRPKSVFSNLLNLCHKELRQFGMQKVIQPNANRGAGVCMSEYIYI